MEDILQNYGGWPVVKGDEWNERDWNWMEINKRMSADGLEDALVFSLSILTDQRNSSRRILDVIATIIIYSMDHLMLNSVLN